MIHQDYSVMLEERSCLAGCGLKFKVMPSSLQKFARSNCAEYCTHRLSSAEIELAEKVIKTPKIEIVKLKKVDEVIPEKIPEKIPVETILVKDDLVEKESVEIEKVLHKSKRTKERLKASDVVSKASNRLQQFKDACIEDAKKIVNRKNSLKIKMDLAFLCLSYANLQGNQSREQSISEFTDAIDVSVKDILSWIGVRESIWEKFEDTSFIEKYSFADLFHFHDKLSIDGGSDSRIALDKAISSRYAVFITDTNSGLKTIDVFYSNNSFDLLSENELDVFNKTINSINRKLKNYLERVRRSK